MNTKTTRLARVPLGKTGIEVSPVAIGTGTHGWSGSSDQTRKGHDWLVDHFRTSHELGINFWDLADQYGSHEFARRALSRVPRGKIVINTKTTANGEAECERAIDRFLKELGTSYVDSILLHGVTSDEWPRTHSGAMRALTRAKKSGKVRAVGISSHGIGALQAAAAEAWVDLILVRLNHAGVNMDAPPEKVIPVLEQAKKTGKGVYAMKVLGCGALSDDPEKAIRWVADLGCVDSMTIGFSGDQELRFAVGFMR